MRADNRAGGRERGEFIAIMHVTVLDFIVASLREGWSEGPVQSNHCEGTGRRVRLSGITLSSKRLLSRQITVAHT